MMFEYIIYRLSSEYSSVYEKLILIIYSEENKSQFSNYQLTQILSWKNKIQIELKS